MSNKAKKRPMLDSDTDESDSDSEESSSQPKKSKYSDVPVLDTSGGMDAAQSSSSGSSSDEDDEWTFEGGGGAGKLGQRTKKPSQTTSVSSDTSSDSGDSSDSSDDESESNTSDASSESDMATGDDLESLIRDEEDRIKLDSMTEREREVELYKRHEQREALKARQKIQKMLKREQKKKKKDHDSKSRILRAKEPKQNKTTRAMDELRATRSADKQKKAERKNVDRSGDPPPTKKQPLQVQLVFTSDEDEEEGGQGKSTLSSLKSKGSHFVSTIEELSKIKLSRYRLEKWVHMPFFEEIVKGCFVRIGIGQHEGRMVYRICEIMKVQETPKVYSLGTARTNKGLKLRFGTQERLFRMEYVSNSPFTEGEFTKWRDENEAHDIELPTLRFVETKVKKLDSTKNVNLKEEDIEKIISEKQKFRKNPYNYALYKNRLLREKEVAETLGNTEKASSIAKELSQLEERAEELDRRRNKDLSAITYINERNRQRNVERAEEALKQEMADNKDKEEDPFTRRKCMPRLVTFGKDGTDAVEIATAQTKKQGGLEDDNQSDSYSQSFMKNELSLTTPLDSSTVPFSTPVSSSSFTEPPRNTGDDLFTAHDFDISIDLPTATQETDLIKATPKQVTTPKNDGPRRSLNLSDYKKRRGLI